MVERLHGPDGAEPPLREANGKCCGAIPRVDVIHLHHGVWLTNGAAGQGEGNRPRRLLPVHGRRARRRRSTRCPSGYGYPIGANDHWVLNYMIHNLTANPAKVYITYDMDFIPADSPAARQHQAGASDLDGRRGPSALSGVQRQPPQRQERQVHVPGHGQEPLPNGAPPLNVFTVDHPGTLIGLPGTCIRAAFTTTLDLIRPGAAPAAGAIRGAVPDSVRLFRSIRALLRQARPDLVGHGDDRHARELAPAHQCR